MKGKGFHFFSPGGWARRSRIPTDGSGILDAMNIKAVIVLTIAKSDELTAEAFVPDEFFLGFS